MDEVKHLIPPKVFEVIDRASICTPKQIIILSCWDIKKITNLSIDDIVLLKNVVSENLRPKIKNCYEFLKEESLKVTSGCEEIDRILNGGFRRGTITEIYGESGSGKTQIGLQAVAHTWPNCSAYICTEDLFPIKRYEEIRRAIPDYSSKQIPSVDHGSNTFVEHITESNDLLSCVRVRLPKLLTQNKFNLIVIDSIAAPFRVENTNYIQRAEEMREFAICLINLAHKFDLAVLCINQVTATFDSTSEMLPSLGLAWSNVVSTRLYLKKVSKTISMKSKNTGVRYTSHVRQLSVCFSPNSPNSIAEFVVTSGGLEGL